jgi:hypothetical protein
MPYFILFLKNTVRAFQFFIGCLFVLSNPLVAQKSPSSIFQTLTKEEGAKMTFEIDMTTLLAKKKTNEYVPAKWIGPNGEMYEIEVRARGKFRRKMCEFPPIKLKFKKKAMTAAGLDTLNEIRLIMPCKDSDQGDDLVVKEYLAYRMYETLTPASIHARLIRLTLVDTHTGKKSNLYAVLMEDIEETLARLKSEEIEAFGLPLDSLNVNQTALVCMFEYMIGNTDWDMSMHRNIRFLRGRDPNGKIIPIPYDFDFSGLVSAPYASPSSESGLKTVRERFYMHNGLSKEQSQKAVKQILMMREPLLQLCTNKFLTKKSSDEMTEYLEGFFQNLSASDVMPLKMKNVLMD